MAPDSSRRNPDDGIPSWAERVVLFLDDGFEVPGTSFRVGFDAVLGLIPGVGDLAMTVSSLSMLWLAFDRGASKPVIARMLVNIGIDALAGAVPLLGDLFDVVFKANRRNLELLRRHDLDPRSTERRSVGYFALIVFAVIALLTVPLVLAVLIVRLMLG